MATLRQRLSVAAKAAAGIFSEDSSRQAYGLLQGLWPASVGDPPTRGARERVAAYADMPWLHALADKVASGVASVQWTLAAVRRRGEPKAVRVKALQRAPARERRIMLGRLKDAGELVEIESHPMLDLLDAGNAMMTGIAVRHVTVLHWDLEGEAFWFKERGALEVPRATWPLPPDWIRALPTPASPSYRVSFRGWQGAIPETEVIWLPRHNPSNPYGRGTGIARALADELETDEYAAKAIRQVFLNQSRPDFLVYPKGDRSWDDVQRRRLAQDWAEQHEGFWRAAKPRFASREVGVHEFKPTDFRQLQMAQLREFQRDLIRQCWGVPPEVMGIVEPGASRATIERASYMFAKWVLEPRLELLRALLQERLAPEFDERLVVDYVSPVEEDREFALAVRSAAPWAWSVDEWRALGDSEPLADGRGERYLVPSSVSPAVDFEPRPALEPFPTSPDEASVLGRLARWLRA